LEDVQVSFRIEGLFTGRYQVCKTMRGFAFHRVIRCFCAFYDGPLGQ
jgi:hypothetical protein